MFRPFPRRVLKLAVAMVFSQCRRAGQVIALTHTDAHVSVMEIALENAFRVPAFIFAAFNSAIRQAANTAAFCMWNVVRFSQTDWNF